MDEYISRKDAIAKIREEGVYGSGYSNEEREDDVVDMLAFIPAADVRPVVRGHWVYEEPNGANSFKGAYWCDQCHQPESYRKNFCPNCGAMMEES